MLSYKLRPARAQRVDPAPAEPPPPPLFKAKPVDPRVLHSCGERGVPKVPRAAVTQPVGFQLRTDARGVSRGVYDALMMRRARHSPATAPQ